MSDQNPTPSHHEAEDSARDKAQRALREMRLNTPMFAYAPLKDSALSCASAP